MRLLRLSLVIVGSAAMIAGGVVALDLLDLGALVSLGVWLAAGVVAHDLLFAPGVALASWLAVRVVPPRYRVPLVVGAVIAGTLALVALPVLGRTGDVPGNPTLLGRPYGRDWLLLELGLALVVAGWLALRWVAYRRRDRGVPPTG